MTFLFTDIEGSTRLWQLDESTMRAAVARHDEILHSTITDFGGTVFSTMGDGVAAVFPSAARAVMAAGEIQRNLGAETWPTSQPVVVRIGLNSGEADVRDGDYFGTAVNRAARVMAIAHGGQVLCSGATAGLVGESLPEELGLLDLGPHRLRDLTAPERIHQVVVPGLPENFPRPRSLDALPGNLPIQATAFVGRERELKELAETIFSARVVTVTGVGGVGKTRLALQAAAEALPSFRDGVWLVELAGVGSPDAVLDMVTSTLEISSVSPAGGLGDALRTKELLLILDNCEHLLTPVAKLVDDLLRVAPDVRVLATSREGLGVSGEHLWAMASMELPDPDEEVSAIAAADSVRLFVERAREANANFTFSDDDAAVISEVCRRLDGIPLAIELAAARVPALTPAEIATHLNRRFKLLTGGRRSVLPRHQTLRNAIEWSYQLLDSQEQTVLDRLSVFAGDFDLAAAQAVASSEDVDDLEVLDTLVRLVGKSLVVAEPTGSMTRYRLLETVREFAWEHLANRSVTEEVSRCHSEFYAKFAHDAGAGLRGPEEADWRDRVLLEMDNLRAALAWAISVQESASALQQIADLSIFGDRYTAYGLLAEDAARVDEEHPLAPVALAAASFASCLQGDATRATQLATEAMLRADALDRSTFGLWARCRVFNGCCMAYATVQGGEELHQFGVRWLSNARELADDWCLCEALTFMIAGTENVEEAVAMGEEAMALSRKLGSASRLSFAASLLGGRLGDTDPDRAEALLAEADEAASLARNDWAEYVRPTAVGMEQARSGNYRVAAETMIEAIELWASRGLPGALLQFVAQLAGVLCALGDVEGALVLAVWAEERGIVLNDSPYWSPYRVHELQALRQGLAAAEGERARRDAAALDNSGVIAYVRGRLATLDDSNGGSVKPKQ